MLNLSPLPEDGFNRFEGIVAAKHLARRNRLQGLKPRIRICYAKFSANISSLEFFLPESLTPVEKSDLIHCYDTSTQPLDQLKKDISDHIETVSPIAASRCQYCTINTYLSTFDHYLPKSIFSEYATYPGNLLPCCSDCNQLKGDKWLDRGQVRSFVNLYHDNLPSNRFLFADLIPSSTYKAVFRLSAQESDYGLLEATIRGHFEHLQLLARFSDAADTHISETKSLVSSMDSKDPASLKSLFLKTSHSLSLDYSQNYWKVALYQAMANNDGFLAYLVSE
jgi:hypothetical protein